MEKLLPDQLKALWQAVDQKQLTIEAFTSEQERLLAAYRQTWEQALLLEGHEGLSESLLAELGSYMQCADMAELQQRCMHAVATLKGEWHAQVEPGNRHSIEQFYDASQATIYELTWWHTLCDDASPLAYVTALHFARQQGCQRFLDFGAGVGSGGILFARHGLEVTLADISSTLLGFSQWRLDRRRLPSAYIDLKVCGLPSQTFDFVTAMDVFEHLVDPVEAVERLWDALKPGGFLYARISAESDEERPQHIVQDFGPTFARMQTLGLVQVWQDEWLWGHQVFQKS
jgi:2-polyprenyl-3-methyl-5-hydroxy-6-metoxy-1,4-benzoquinol methylase